MERAVKALVSDLDGTLLGDDAGLAAFADWLAPRRRRWRLVYASGRFVESVRADVGAAGLPEPDAVIGGVGTEIHDPADAGAAPAWRRRIERGFSAPRVRELLAGQPGLELQPAEFQTDLKVSFYLHDAEPEQLRRIGRVLAGAGLRARIIYSSSRDLDVLPAAASKGAAARFLAERWDVPGERVIVSGDSGNDASLFEQGFRGIIVANAQPELKALRSPQIFHASRPYAGGVLEGLKHWTEGSPPDEPD